MWFPNTQRHTRFVFTFTDLHVDCYARRWWWCSSSHPCCIIESITLNRQYNHFKPSVTNLNRFQRTSIRSADIGWTAGNARPARILILRCSDAILKLIYRQQRLPHQTRQFWILRRQHVQLVKSNLFVISINVLFISRIHNMNWVYVLTFSLSHSVFNKWKISPYRGRKNLGQDINCLTLLQVSYQTISDIS